AIDLDDRYVAKGQPELVGEPDVARGARAIASIDRQHFWSAPWKSRLPGSVHDPARAVNGGFPLNADSGFRTPKSRAQTSLPWQCLNFLPEPHGQVSLRPTLPQLAGSLGSRSAGTVGGDTAMSANGTSSSPVIGSSLCASIGGSCCGCSGGTISTRISCAVTASRKCEISPSNSVKASALYSLSGSRWP